MESMFKELPSVVIKGIVPMPNVEYRFEFNKQHDKNALDDSNRGYAKFIILLVQMNPLLNEPTTIDLYETAVLAKIVSTTKQVNDNVKVRFQCISRVKINEYLTLTPPYIVSYEELKSFTSDRNLEIAFTKMINDRISKSMDSFYDPQSIREKISQGITSEQLTDLLAYNLRINNPLEKFKYLSELDVITRMKWLMEDLSIEELSQELEHKIQDEVNKSINDTQKEYILREKLKAIQNELGDKAKKEEDIEELRKQILASGMPKNIEEKALKELARYSSSSSQTPDSNVIKNYLDFMVELPWNKVSADNEDLTIVKEKLDQDHYGLEQVKERIIEYLAVKIKTKKNPQTILCLVGPAGTGKTTLAISIADALGRKFIKQSLGGVKDEAEIRGHRRTYVGALPGRILSGMKEAKTINPVFLIDEIDKMSADYKGDPSSAMLEVLDPEQNSKFSDHYLEEYYDLSQVLFIATANYLENVPAPLRDRMEIVELSSYTEHEKFHIAKKHLIEKQLKAHGITNENFSITDECIYYLIQHYTREAGVRELQRFIGTLIRKTIKDILLKKVERVDITMANIEAYLGKPRFFHNEVENKPVIGQVTGLAYTQYGGDTMPIEVTYYKGTGNLVLTGKLGDVMKESAMIALSFVKSKATEYGIDPDMFGLNNFHIHAPEGAIPKDGPSAGVTIATAIYSAVTKKAPKALLGMTGEITLSGQVLPIGGLREKSIAALRSGLTEILVPKDNEKDLEEIPVEVREKLKVTLISNVKDVFRHAF
ncbi:MAG: endopeptidase La [Acholeplasmatales bacterium]|jgi:ATP-dependent Lon protease|nr:endopeptidase La [Acholeplasmatales bacterium]